MRKRKIWASLSAAFCMVILIMDSSTALAGAKDGIHLCINSVIPSLFPMFVLTMLLSSNISGTNTDIGRKIGGLCKIPAGAESLLILGLLSGYPVGAQCVTDAYQNKQISKSTAHRLLGFCSNAGPAFIFGMVGSLFPSISTAFVLWFIHILATLIIGFLLPVAEHEEYIVSSRHSMSISGAVEKSIKSLAQVCGWIVLFRIIIAVIEKWLFISAKGFWPVTFSGILELANGIHGLKDITNLGTCFVLSSTILGFGGICVLLQTHSVTAGLGLGYYFPGKVLHAAISFIISSIVQFFIFPKANQWSTIWLTDMLLIILCVIIVIFLYKQNNSSISDKISV